VTTLIKIIAKRFSSPIAVARFGKIRWFVANVALPFHWMKVCPIRMLRTRPLNPHFCA